MIPPYVSPLFNHLWQSTLVAVVAGLLALGLRRNYAKTRYTIWLVASLKFLFPFSVLMAIGSRFEWHSAVLLPHSASTQVMEEVFAPAAVTDVTAVSTGTVTSLVPIVLLVIWAIGFVAVLVWWWLRWKRVRALVRAAKPLSVAGDVPVLVSRALMEPGVVGIVRPVLLLPGGISEHLAPAHLEAILAHELCHIRRRDNLAAALHMVVEAIFWFHPLVWWIGARLVEERERACDEEVLRLGSKPQVYAESILKTCQYYLETPMACMSGVTGADLKKRIVHIMTHGAASRLALGKKLLLAVIGIAAIAGPIAYGLAKTPQSQSSNPTVPAAVPSFEVASVRPNKSGSFHSSWNENDGRVIASNVSLRDYVEWAYGVRAYQISAPDWLKSERFDIAAKAAGPVDKDQVQLMLQTLLADRFKLILHHEQKVLPVYALVVAKNGPKLEAVKSEGHSSTNSNAGHLNGQRASMTQFAEVLSRRTDRPVVDMTGLKGAFNFKLEWTPDDTESRLPGKAEAVATNENDAPSIFTAIQEQLGLKLVARKAPTEILVIDHVEKTPTEN